MVRRDSIPVALNHTKYLNLICTYLTKNVKVITRQLISQLLLNEVLYYIVSTGISLTNRFGLKNSKHSQSCSWTLLNETKTTQKGIYTRISFKFFRIMPPFSSFSHPERRVKRKLNLQYKLKSLAVENCQKNQ